MIENLENKSIELTRAFSRITQYPHTQFQYHLVKLCIAGTPTSLIRQIRPSLTIPHLISKFHSETLRWLGQAASYSISIPHPPLREVSILIAGTRCSEGGLNLSLNYHHIAPLAFLTTTISNCITLRTIYSNENPEHKHILLALIDQLLLSPIDPDEILLSTIPRKTRSITSCDNFYHFK